MPNMNTATRALRVATRRRLPQAITAVHPLTRLTAARAIHTSPTDQANPRRPDPREHLTTIHKENIARKGLVEFDLTGKVFVVTGGAQGLGLTLAEALAEAGGKVYALDRAPTPGAPFIETASSLDSSPTSGSLHYHQQDVSDTTHLDTLIASIASEHNRLDGAVAAAGIQQITPALDYKPADVARMLEVNYTGVFATAQSAARQMFKYKTRGSICLIASMSGLIANKGLLSPVYNSSKAAVIQLARNLAMEWSRVREDGSGGVRVNCISPGHIITPMVRKNFEEVPGLQETWERENMMGRLADPTEFKGAVLFLLSGASSFMTGSNMVIDGGHTAW